MDKDDSSPANLMNQEYKLKYRMDNSTLLDLSRRKTPSDVNSIVIKKQNGCQEIYNFYYNND